MSLSRVSHRTTRVVLTRHKRWTTEFLILSLLLSAVVSTFTPLPASAGQATDSTSANSSWTSFIYNYENSRYVQSSAINSTNVCHLLEKWFYSAGGVTSTPTVNNGTVYFANWAGDVYALNLTTGGLIWETHLGSGAVTGTPTIVNGSLYVATNSGSVLYDLSALNGKIVWMTDLTLFVGSEIWASPIFYQGRLYIGITGDRCECNGSQYGELFSINATTGTTLWSFNASTSAASGGAPVWGSIAVDTSSDSIFFGTGNPYTNSSDLYTDTVISLNATTGSLIWYNQVTTCNRNVAGCGDFDFGSTPNLFTMDVNGSEVEAVGIGSKDGNLSPLSNYYIFYRNNGTLISKISSASLGGGVIGLAGFLSTSPSNTEIFVPTYQQVNETYSGALTAVFASNDSVAWSYKTGIEWGSVTIVPGAVLVGDLAGNLYAISTFTGQLLYETHVLPGIADGITVVNNTILFGNWPTVTTSNQTGYGLYAYSLSSDASECVPLTTPASSTTASTASTMMFSSTSSSSISTSTSSTTTSSTTSTGAVSEFPYQVFATSLLIAVLAVSYLAVRRRQPLRNRLR
jgi:polyvinyl alcohol dehydrogenase (cytochrome)